MKVSAVMLLSVLSVFLISFSSPLAQIYQGSMSVEEIFDPDLRLQASLSRALDTYRIAGLYDQGAIQAFYNENDNNLYWVGEDRLNPKGQALLATLEGAWTHGLNPDRYHYSRLMEMLERGRYRDIAYFDLLMTDGFARYVRDMSGARVNMRGLKAVPRSWRKPVGIDAALALLKGSDDLETALEKVHPKGTLYNKLRAELIRLNDLPHDALDDTAPLDFDKVLFPGERHARIPDLRSRMNVEAQTRDAYLYDDRLAAAVIKFQREHKVKDDGIIGADTLHILNRTRGARIAQVVANMERLRWLGEERPSKYVTVNIPSATLWAVDNGAVEFEMPVIVGKNYRATTSFVAQISGMRLNPTWTVPATIKRFDIWPKLKKDPSYLEAKGIELWKGYGRNARSIDPATIDWNKISWNELWKIRMVQVPGDHNALGRYRVLMQNPYDIYLHDTNHPELFDNDYRALSSGCVRLSDPARMARFILKGERKWSKAKIEETLSSLEKTDIEIGEEVPVYLLYQTMWLDEQGRVVYGTDIYGQDKKLVEKLADIDALPSITHNKESVLAANSRQVDKVVTR